MHISFIALTDFWCRHFGDSGRVCLIHSILGQNQVWEVKKIKTKTKKCIHVHGEDNYFSQDIFKKKNDRICFLTSFKSQQPHYWDLRTGAGSGADSHCTSQAEERLAFQWVKKPGDAQFTLLYIPSFRLLFSQLFTGGCIYRYIYIYTLYIVKTKDKERKTD